MKFSSIRNQILANTLIPLLLVICFVALFILIESLEKVEGEMDRRGNDIATQAVSMSEFHFYTGNIEKLSEIADLMSNIDGLVSIRFKNELGQVLVQRTQQKVKGEIKQFVIPIYSSDTGIDDFSTFSDATEETSQLGSIEVSLSRSGLTDKRKQVYWRVLVISILALLFAVLFAYISSHRISRSMTTLMDTAREIKSKNFSQRCKVNGLGEIRELQTIFNDMADSIEKNDQELQKRIDFATASLNASVTELSRKNQQLAEQRRETIELERSKAISDERARIMKDMHDGVGGQLVASLAMIEKEPDTETKRNISSTLTECLDDFRLIINSLNESANSLADLLADFRYRNARKLKNLGIELNWNIADSVDEFRIQPQQGLHILRILQEAFTNTYKHANATEMSLDVFKQSDRYHLLVSDNGTFDANIEHYGQGLKNMRWRAHQLEAELNLFRNTDGGCTIELIVQP